MKKLARISLKIVAGIILAMLAVSAALQSPRVQSYIGAKIAARFQEKTDADITFKMLALRPFEAITLDDVVITDRNPYYPGTDTLAVIGSLSTKFSLMGFLSGTGAYVNQIKLEDAMFQLVTEPDSLSENGTRTNLQRIFRLKSAEKKEGDPTWGNILSARALNIRNFRFILKNPVSAEKLALKGVKSGKIDFNNLDVTVESLKARRMKVADSRVLLTLDNLAAHENNSGYQIKRVSSKRVRVSMDLVRLEYLKIQDRYSDLSLSRIQLDGRLANYSEFIDSIRVSGEIRSGSTLDMRSISYFGPGLDNMTFRGDFSGMVNGYINDLMLRDITVRDLNNNFNMKATGRIMNVTDIQNCGLDMKMREAHFTLKGLGGFIQAWAPEANLDLSRMVPGEIFDFTGQTKGLINRLDVTGNLSSRLGQAKADITVRNTVDPARPIIIDGGINTRDLNIGKIAGIDAIGPVTLGSALSATLPRSGSPSVRLDSLRIDRLNALGYDYTNISAAGSYAEDAFDGRIIAADPNLSFLFQGRFHLSNKTKNAVYRFYASLGYADLHALNIDKRPQSKISLQAVSNFLLTESGDLLGDINLSDLTLVSATGTHNLGDISVRAHANDNVNRIKLDSRIMEGSFVGDKSIISFVQDLRSLVLDRELSALSEAHAPEWDGSTYKLNLKVKGAQALLDFLAPGSYVANPTELNLTVDEGGIVTGAVKSGRIALRDKFIKDLNLTLSNERDVLRANMESSSIQLASGAKLLDSRIDLFANDNKVGLGYRFDNGETETTKAEIFLNAELSRDHEGLAVLARALPSNLYYKGSGWAISSGDVLYHAGDVNIDRLRFSHDDELLEIMGGYSSRKADTLRVRMEKFDIGLANTFTGGMVPLEGYASGNAVVISAGSPIPGIEANIVCDSTLVSGQRMGSLYVSSWWDASAKRFNMDVHNSLGGQSSLSAGGYFMPDGQILNIDAALDKLNLAVASPILATIFSTFDGNLSGKVHANGPLRDLKVSSRGLNITDGHIALDFTRAVYNLSGDLDLDQDALHFTNVHLTDNAGGKAAVKGDVLFGGFKELGTKLHVDLYKIKALDLKRGENSLLSGTLPVSGAIDINGPVSRLVVDINATTSAPGNLHLILGSSSGELERKMLVFTEPPDDLQQDPYELMMASNAKQAASASNLIINLTAHATPEAAVFIDMGENTLNARGNGTIGINLETAQNNFGLSGDYTLSEGSFRFSAMNIVSRDFSIQDGSSVRFNGPINETDLNVRGLYVTKASISNLITSTIEDKDNSGSGRRTVICGIDITGKLSNPEVYFSIDIPDLNPSTKMEVENAFSTEDKIQKQFLYLLIAGSFLPEEESGITSTGSSMLFSNISSIMSGQINNIFEKLNIPLDLGLNYQYQAQQGQNMFDVAVSTQLFHNRVIVNGAVGNKQKIGSTTSEVTGDIDVEVKINKAGTLRTTVFSHSADQFSTYLDNSQRNGIGITYQREFDSFLVFLKELFLSSREREQRAMARYGRQAPQTVIQVDSTGKSKVISNGQR